MVNETSPPAALSRVDHASPPALLTHYSRVDHATRPAGSPWLIVLNGKKGRKKYCNILNYNRKSVFRVLVWVILALQILEPAGTPLLSQLHNPTCPVFQ